MLLKDLQPQKARIPMSVTDSGIAMLSKENSILEGTVPNGSHWLGIAPNSRHRVRDSNACQRLTTWKGRDTNGCERLMDSEYCQRLAIYFARHLSQWPSLTTWLQFLQAPISLREQGMFTWRKPSVSLLLQLCFWSKWESLPFRHATARKLQRLIST